MADFPTLGHDLSMKIAGDFLELNRPIIHDVLKQQTMGVNADFFLGGIVYFNIKLYSWTTAFRRPWCFVHIGGVGWGGVGHVITFMWTSEEGHACLWLPVGACMHGWGGVGWGM